MFLRKTSYGYFVRTHGYSYVVILAPNGYWYIPGFNGNTAKFSTFNQVLDHICCKEEECST